MRDEKEWTRDRGEDDLEDRNHPDDLAILIPKGKVTAKKNNAELRIVLL